MTSPCKRSAFSPTRADLGEPSVERRLWGQTRKHHRRQAGVTRRSSECTEPGGRRWDSHRLLRVGYCDRLTQVDCSRIHWFDWLIFFHPPFPRQKMRLPERDVELRRARETLRILSLDSTFKKCFVIIRFTKNKILVRVGRSTPWIGSRTNYNQFQNLGIENSLELADPV